VSSPIKHSSEWVKIKLVDGEQFTASLLIVVGALLALISLTFTENWVSSALGIFSLGLIIFGLAATLIHMNSHVPLSINLGEEVMKHGRKIIPLKELKSARCGDKDNGRTHAYLKTLELKTSDGAWISIPLESGVMLSMTKDKVRVLTAAISYTTITQENEYSEMSKEDILEKMLEYTN
jgi:hypothetical protein